MEREGLETRLPDQRLDQGKSRARESQGTESLGIYMSTIIKAKGDKSPKNQKSLDPPEKSPLRCFGLFRFGRV
jgi:hypothetical protein